VLQILDSAFADLVQLAEEMVAMGREQGLTVPAFAVKIALRLIRSTVAKTANFNIRVRMCALMCDTPS
jgi:hypothetical protein